MKHKIELNFEYIEGFIIFHYPLTPICVALCSSIMLFEVLASLTAATVFLNIFFANPQNVSYTPLCKFRISLFVYNLGEVKLLQY